MLQFGFLFAPKKIAPKFGVLNPFPGLKRMFFSMQALVQLAKQLAKITVVFVIVFMQLHDQITGLLFARPRLALRRSLHARSRACAFGIGIRFGILFFVLGMADYFYEKYRLAESLKMTKTEVKDEHRQQDGNPEMQTGRQAAPARHAPAGA